MQKSYRQAANIMLLFSRNQYTKMNATNTAAESATLTITGYDNDTVCECCGKSLVHGIRLDDGRTVGAQCFNKVLTKPLTYSGKTYRLGAENIIKYAKAAQFYTPSEAGRRFGIYPYMLIFKSVE